MGGRVSHRGLTGSETPAEVAQGELDGLSLSESSETSSTGKRQVVRREEQAKRGRQEEDEDQEITTTDLRRRCRSSSISDKHVQGLESVSLLQIETLLDFFLDPPELFQKERKRKSGDRGVKSRCPHHFARR